MEKLGIQRKEGKTARVSQPPLPAQESTEGPASPHCRAGRMWPAPPGSGRWAPTGQQPSVLGAKATVLCAVAGVWDGRRWEEGSVLSPPTLGGRQSRLQLLSDRLAPLSPPGILCQQSYRSIPLLPPSGTSQPTQGEVRGLPHRPNGMCSPLPTPPHL